MSTAAAVRIGIGVFFSITGCRDSTGPELSGPMDLAGHYSGLLEVSIPDSLFGYGCTAWESINCYPAYESVSCPVVVDIVVSGYPSFRGAFTIDTVGGCPHTCEDGTSVPQLGNLAWLRLPSGGTIENGVIDTASVAHDGGRGRRANIRFTIGDGSVQALDDLVGCSVIDRGLRPVMEGFAAQGSMADTTGFVVEDRRSFLAVLAPSAVPQGRLRFSCGSGDYSVGLALLVWR
jgi:hypothetical protein